MCETFIVTCNDSLEFQFSFKGKLVRKLNDYNYDNHYSEGIADF